MGQPLKPRSKKHGLLVTKAGVGGDDVRDLAGNGFVHTIDAKFPKDGVEEWTINVRRANGKMSAQGRGTNTRRKKE